MFSSNTQITNTEDDNDEGGDHLAKLRNFRDFDNCHGPLIIMIILIGYVLNWRSSSGVEMEREFAPLWLKEFEMDFKSDFEF